MPRLEVDESDDDGDADCKAEPEQPRVEGEGDRAADPDAEECTRTPGDGLALSLVVGSVVPSVGPFVDVVPIGGGRRGCA